MIDTNRFFETFLTSILMDDGASAITYFDLPMLSADRDHKVTLANSAELHRAILLERQFYADLGFSQTRLVSTEVREMGPEFLSVDVHWTLTDTTGTRARDLFSTYILRHEGTDAWISAIFHHEDHAAPTIFADTIFAEGTTAYQ